MKSTIYSSEYLTLKMLRIRNDGENLKETEFSYFWGRGVKMLKKKKTTYTLEMSKRTNHTF